MHCSKASVTARNTTSLMFWFRKTQLILIYLHCFIIFLWSYLPASYLILGDNIYLIR